jgi:hypothetical protein
LTAEKTIIPTKWTCFNETKKQAVPIHPIPVKHDEALNMMDVLVFFEKPSASISQGVVLTIRSYFLLPRAMIALEKGNDYIRVSNPHTVPIEQTDIVLLYPKAFGPVGAAPDPEGEPISEDVKNAYLGLANQDYEAVGCSAKLLPDSKFRVNFFRNN